MLVLCALPAERRALAPLVRPGVSLATTGMGAAAASRRAPELMEDDPAAVIAAGFCGALDARLGVGDLVAAERVVDEASGAAFPAHPGLLAAAPGQRGTLVSARRLARTPADRALLAGDAVDLESAAIARAAAARGIPFLALRAVTDEVHHRLPDFEALMNAAGRLTPGAGLLYFLRRPGDVPALLRLGPAARRASASLRAGVAELLGALA